jgi:hypothetical protein
MDDLELQLEQFLRQGFKEKLRPKAFQVFHAAVDEIVQIYLAEFSAYDALEALAEHRSQYENGNRATELLDAFVGQRIHAKRLN